VVVSQNGRETLPARLPVRKAGVGRRRASIQGLEHRGQRGKVRSNGTKAHHGVDYAGEEGDPVKFMNDGKVIPLTKRAIGYYGGHSVRTSSSINGINYTVDYGQLQSNVVTVGQDVSAGDLVGCMGRLGNLAGTSYPTHVHISVWRPVCGNVGLVMPWWR